MITFNKEFTDKHVLVVGATGGIGSEICRKLAKEGAKLSLIARNEEKLEQLKSELSGANHIICLADMNDTDSISSTMDDLVAKAGPLDGLVYCAGITKDRPLRQFKPDVVAEVMRVNLLSFIEIVRCATSVGHFNKGLKIVGISSNASTIGETAHTAYAASKAGMDAAVRCMAKELSGKGINVNTIQPGMIDTEMYQSFLKNHRDPDEANKALINRQYLGVGKPEDVAELTAFLLSSSSKFITGTSIPLDGGSTSS